MGFWDTLTRTISIIGNDIYFLVNLQGTSITLPYTRFYGFQGVLLH
jgi:hypothetical protein